MPYRIASGKERLFGMGAALFIGVSLAFGMIPTGNELSDHFLRWAAGRPATAFEQLFSFPILAAFFCFSLPLRCSLPNEPESLHHLWWQFPAPLVVAFLWGFFQTPSRVSIHGLFWVVCLAPIGEELLFRGWLYGLFERYFPKCYFTLTNPMPVSLWASSLAFSLWHMQNADGMASVVFQIFYTFFVGAWLSFLRWHSGGLLLPIAGHALLNGMSVLSCILIQ
jgi:membrane protease YdiL (CAAX protease family)